MNNKIKLRRIEVSEGGWSEEDKGVKEYNLNDFIKCEEYYYLKSEIEEYGIENEENDFYLIESENYKEDLEMRLNNCVLNNKKIFDEIK